MTVLIYDGTFSGFLTTIFEVYEYKFEQPIIHRESEYQAVLMDTEHRVVSNPDKSKRVWKGLSEKISALALRAVYRSFLSEEKNMENVLLSYINYVFSSSNSVEYDFSHPAVLKIQQVAKMVYREKHRMEAFVRFQLTKDGLYYALIQPDFNVLPLIRKHFADRYADQRWVIYDSKRKYGIYYDLKEVTEIEMSFDDKKPCDISAVYEEGEELYQELWKQYFSSVNIAARKNMKLHIRHMPKRYWKNLIEKQEREGK